jgi:8-amino-7-oxononanoate synthase
MLGFLSKELERLEQESLRRHLRTVTQTEKAKLYIDGNPLLNFSSNNYLGLARHPQVLEAVKQVLEHWGVGATSSRLISGTSVIHQDLESALAAFLHQKAALLLPAGYMAHHGVMTSLVGPGDAVVLDRLCHASLVDAARLSGARVFVFTHRDIHAAEKALKRMKSYRRRLLVTESLFSMNGDFAPLRALADLAHHYGAMTLLDEAHAIGVWGFHGRGVLGMEGMDDRWDVIVGTLSKALGSQGGVVAGSHELIETLMNKARSFIFTTGLSPACVAAAQAALALVQEDAGPRAHVQKLSGHLREGLRLQGWDILHSESQIVPILLGDAKSALACADHLYRAGIFAPAIRPPTVHDGECRIRFSVTSEHTLADVDQLLKVLSHFPLSSRRAGINKTPSPLAGEGGDGGKE